MLWAHKLRVPVSHACMRVLMVLAEHADDDGSRCYPALDRIASEAQTDRKTVVRCLDKLEQDGIIARQAGGGRTRSTEYRLCMEFKQPETVAQSHSIQPKNSGAEPQNTDGNSGAVTINSGLVTEKQWPGATLLCPEPVHTLSEKVEASQAAPPPPADCADSIKSAIADRPDPRGSRLPTDWQPGADGMAYAVEHGLDTAAVAEDFRDFWLAKAGKDGRKADWPRTWKRWCREEAKRRPRARASPRYDGRSDEAVMRAAGLWPEPFETVPPVKAQGFLQ